MRCDIDVDAMLAGLSSSGGIGGQDNLDLVRLCCYRGVCRWVLEGDDDVGLLVRDALYRKGNDVRAI